MKKLIIVLVVLVVSCFHFSDANAVGCFGKIFNPVSDLNWNNAFPITIGGIKNKQGPNSPPLHSMPAICNCSLTPGVGVTYWEAKYVAEVARTSGCLSTLGGVESMGNSLAYQNSNQGASDRTGSRKSRSQVHWYRYPVMAMMDIMATYAHCMTVAEFGLAAPTEVDPDWNNGAFSTLSQAETLLFSNPIAALSCVPEAGTALFNFNVDPMYWCAGSEGTIFPLTGTSQNYSNEAKGNLQILAKFVARQFRIGGLLVSIGPWAQCNARLSPIWLKSQFRIDHIYPIHVNRTIIFGKPEAAFALPGLNTPVQTDSAYMIWEGKQCCASVL